MVKDILIIIQDKLARHIFPVIRLPWKKDMAKVGDQITLEGSLMVFTSKDIVTDNCKASGSNSGTSNTATRTRMEADTDAEAMFHCKGQQDSKQELCKVPKNSSRIQRNCPKNEDFLWI